jgi:hypothetical protein
MNKKQMVVLWLMVLSLSLAGVVAGIARDDILLTIGVPVVLFGMMLLYQFRDRNKPISSNRLQRLLLTAVSLLAIQTVLMGLQASEIRRFKRVESYVDGIQANISSIESHVSDMQRDVDAIESNSSQH